MTLVKIMLSDDKTPSHNDRDSREGDLIYFARFMHSTANPDPSKQLQPCELAGIDGRDLGKPVQAC